MTLSKAVPTPTLIFALLAALQAVFFSSLVTAGTIQSGADRPGAQAMFPDKAPVLAAHRITLRDATLDVAFAPGELAVSQGAVLGWVSASAQAVADFYGRFPVEHVRILILPVEGNDVQSGTAYGSRGAAINVAVGRFADADDLARDWIMTHEMVHLALPDLPDIHSWMEEGVATYVEPLARVQSGQLTKEQLWGDLVRGLPQGLPQAGDRGLDRTPTWGRTYWGGALFCLLADITIRQRTQNRQGLQDALRGILDSGANIEVEWSIGRALQVGDAATGTQVLRELYQQMRATPVRVDLPQLWRLLGVKVRGEFVLFDEQAPLAPLRRAITRNLLQGAR